MAEPSRMVKIDALVRATKCATCGAKPSEPCIVIQANQSRIGQPTKRMHIARYYAMWEARAYADVV